MATGGVVSPISWTHHYVWVIVVAIGAIAAGGARIPDWLRWISLAWSAWVSLCPVLVFLPYGMNAELGYSIGQHIVGGGVTPGARCGDHCRGRGGEFGLVVDAGGRGSGGASRVTRTGQQPRRPGLGSRRPGPRPRVRRADRRFWCSRFSRLGVDFSLTGGKCRSGYRGR